LSAVRSSIYMDSNLQHQLWCRLDDGKWWILRSCLDIKYLNRDWRMPFIRKFKYICIVSCKYNIIVAEKRKSAVLCFIGLCLSFSILEKF